MIAETCRSVAWVARCQTTRASVRRGEHACWTVAGLLARSAPAQTLVWHQKIPNVIVGSIGADDQSAFRADADHLKPHVADCEPVERAGGSAAENSDPALTTVYRHDFGPAEDQVSMYPHQKLVSLPQLVCQPWARKISSRQRRSNLCDYRTCLGAKWGWVMARETLPVSSSSAVRMTRKRLCLTNPIVRWGNPYRDSRKSVSHKSVDRFETCVTITL